MSSSEPLGASARILVGLFLLLRDGGTVDVTYWPLAPKLASIEPAAWNSPVFVALFGLTLGGSLSMNSRFMSRLVDATKSPLLQRGIRQASNIPRGMLGS